MPIEHVLLYTLWARTAPRLRAVILGRGHLKVRSTRPLIVATKLDIEVAQPHPGNLELKISSRASDLLQIPEISSRTKDNYVHLQLLGL